MIREIYSPSLFCKGCFCHGRSPTLEKKQILSYNFLTQYIFLPCSNPLISLTLKHSVYVYALRQTVVQEILWTYKILVTQCVLKYPSVLFSLSSIYSHWTESTNSVVMPISYINIKNFLTAFHCHLQIQWLVIIGQRHLQMFLINFLQR